MKRVALGTCLIALLAVCDAGAGAKIETGSNTWIEAGFLGQLQFVNLEKAADKNDIYLRRGRIILQGQIQDGLRFFAETDNDNAGKNGTSVSTDIQDAFADLRLFKNDSGEHWVKAGLILLPFSFENRASAASLLGLDYNSEAIKLVNTFVWRDYGAELHGSVQNKFAYFVGVFDGYDVKDSDKNPDASMRFTGHLACNLVGNVETDFFFTQERLAKKGDYVSIGAGADHQADATLTITKATNNIPEQRIISDNDAWVVDFQSGCSIKNCLLTLNGGYYVWDNSSFDGITASVEGGIMYANNQLTMKYSVQNPDGKDSTADYTAGYNYFLKGHNARMGIEYRWGDSDRQILAGIQFLF